MNCRICKQPLDQIGNIAALNCGGDCLACMARNGDPDCIETLINHASGLNRHEDIRQLVNEYLETKDATHIHETYLTDRETAELELNAFLTWIQKTANRNPSMHIKYHTLQSETGTILEHRIVLRYQPGGYGIVLVFATKAAAKAAADLLDTTCIRAILEQKQ